MQTAKCSEPVTGKFSHKHGNHHGLSHAHHLLCVYSSQVRPADVHTERENKLFVGMLPKNLDDTLLESIFTPYGKIKEIHIIRTPEVRHFTYLSGAPFLVTCASFLIDVLYV